MRLINAIVRVLFGDRALIRWTFCSAGSFLAVVGLTAFFREVIGLNAKLAFLFPLIIVFFVNFLTARYLVYGRPTLPIGRQFLAYSLAAFSFRGLEYGAYWTLLDWLGVHYLVAASVVMPSSFISKFAFYKLTIFGSQESTESATSGACGANAKEPPTAARDAKFEALNT